MEIHRKNLNIFEYRYKIHPPPQPQQWFNFLNPRMLPVFGHLFFFKYNITTKQFTPTKYLYFISYCVTTFPLTLNLQVQNTFHVLETPYILTKALPIF